MLRNCPRSNVTPTYDDIFFKDIEICEKVTRSDAEYCDCYDSAARESQARAEVNQSLSKQQQAQDAYRKLFPRMSPGVAPPLNVPSRANQKVNTFSKVFDPTKRKILILLIASVLLFVAIISYD